MSYEFEQKKLLHYIGSDLAELLFHHNAYIAGGTITSLFCNRDINDIDIYFRDEQSLVNFLYDIWDDGRHVVAHTKKATLIRYGDLDIQLVHFDYFRDADAIFNTFDFTVCMGAYDFADDSFHLHPQFMQHNSQRMLKFNAETAFPIVSLLRVQKYRDKGYKISKPEFLRIALACMNLDITSWDELREQLGGMYGVNYDKLFDFDDDTPLDLTMVIDKLADLSLDDDYFKEPESLPFNSVEDIIDNISTGEIVYYEINDGFYRYNSRGYLVELDHKPKNAKVLDGIDYINSHRFYKFVRKDDDGTYHSFYDNTFEYVVGEEALARQTDKLITFFHHKPVLFFNELPEIRRSMYVNHENAVLIEVSIAADDFVDKNDDKVTATKCKVLREVPKSEYAIYLPNYN